METRAISLLLSSLCAKHVWRLLGLLAVFGLSTTSGTALAESADSLLIVDCLLPGKIQRIGNAATYVTARKALKTSAADCRSRGGEYTAAEQVTLGSLMRTWLPMAEKGDVEAQTNLGEILERGIGGAPQPELAVRWYELAASRGYSRAQVDLGAMYERGRGVPQDLAKATEWYRRASGITAPLTAAPASDELIRTQQERDDLARKLDAERQKRQQLEDELNAVRQRLNGERTSLLQQQRQLDESRNELDARARILEEQHRLQMQQNATAHDRTAARRLTDLQRQFDEQRRIVAARDAELQRLHSSIQALESKSASLTVQLAGTEVDRATAQAQETAAREQSAKLSQQLRDANDALANQLTVIASQQAATEQLRRELADQQSKLNGGSGDHAALEARLHQRESELAESRRQLGLLNAQIANLDEQSQTARRTTRATTSAIPSANINFGRYHALVIGNNNFRFIPKLRTAVRDAQAVAELLHRRYGFETTVLIDADRYQILSALNRLRETLTQDDNLLIYYAGHGQFDADNDRGYWLPVDAESDSSANWISTYQVTDILKAIPAKQIILVADSCYAGMLTRSAITRLNVGMTDEQRQRWYQTLTTKHARVVLTSGGVQPVLDSGGGQHSVFAAAFIQILEGNQEVLEGQRLAQEVTRRVAISVEASKIEQVPMYAPLTFAGHEAGDFIFVPK